MFGLACTQASASDLLLIVESEDKSPVSPKGLRERTREWGRVKEE